MKTVKTLLLVFAVLSSLNVSAQNVDLFRQETQIRKDGGSQLNSTWWMHTQGAFHFQAYSFWETTTGTWSDVNITFGPAMKAGRFELTFPAGVRFHPEDGWELSHVITKANAFGQFGDWSFLIINDLSWSVEEGRNEHFLQYQTNWHRSDQWIGFGLQTDLFLLGSSEAEWTVGPVFIFRYLSNSTESRSWNGTLEVYPFYAPTDSTVGVKFNLLNFRFSKSK